MKYWLMKSEPDVFSIEHLAKSGKTLWEGVRNYQARNFMIKDMSLGDKVLFYHSNAKPSGIAGLASVSGKSRPDPTQFDKKSIYYEQRATPENPVWHCVEIIFEKKFKQIISLEILKNIPELKNMLLVQRGQRLSIQPVTKEEYHWILLNLVK